MPQRIPLCGIAFYLGLFLGKRAIVAGRFFCVRCSRHFSWALYCGLGCFAVHGLFLHSRAAKVLPGIVWGGEVLFSFSKKSVFKILYFGLFFFCVFLRRLVKCFFWGAGK
jgi:hypothetical protein